MALNDRSKHLRSEACALLTIALGANTMADLNSARQKYTDECTLDSISASIKCGNSNNLIDHDHSGRVKLTMLRARIMAL